MSNTLFSDTLIVYLVGIFAIGIAVCIGLLRKNKKKLAAVGLGATLVLAAAALLVGLAIKKADDRKYAWDQDTNFGSGNASRAVELISAAIADKRSALAESFLDEDFVTETHALGLQFVDGKFFTLRFVLMDDQERKCKDYQIGPDDRFFVEDATMLSRADDALPTTVLKRLLSVLDEERWIEKNFDSKSGVLRIDFIAKRADCWQTDKPFYIVSSDSTEKSEGGTVEGTSYLFRVTCEERMVILAVKA